jgi:hypothetical protein
VRTSTSFRPQAASDASDNVTTAVLFQPHIRMNILQSLVCNSTRVNYTTRAVVGDFDDVVRWLVRVGSGDNSPIAHALRV